MQKESALQNVLVDLAGPLLRAGITPKRFAQLSARAFAKYAAEYSVLKNGRVNFSRVAVATGLTRPEVKRLLSKFPSETTRTQTRSTRVVRGWLSDPNFLTRGGRPRALKLRGAVLSFEQLVRQHAGDVPFRAVLTELIRANTVELKRHHVVLICRLSLDNR